MGRDVLLHERLLDQNKSEGVELAQVVEVGQAVGRVRIDLQQGVRAEEFAHGGDRLEVPAGFDLEFNAPIPGVDVHADLGQQSVEVGADTHRNPAVHPHRERARLLHHAAEKVDERPIRCPQLRIQHGCLERGLGHPVSHHEAHQGVNVVRGHSVRAQQRRREVVAYHVLAAVHVLGAVARRLPGHTFSPALGSVHRAHVHEQNDAHGLPAERGLEGPHKRHCNAVQGDRLQRDRLQRGRHVLHAARPGAPGRSAASVVKT